GSPNIPIISDIKYRIDDAFYKRDRAFEMIKRGDWLAGGLEMVGGFGEFTTSPLAGILDSGRAAYFGRTAADPTDRATSDFVVTVGSLWLGANGLAGGNSNLGPIKFVEQGFTSAQADYLAQPYTGLGHHFIPRRVGLPSDIADSSLNLLKPSN